MNLQPCRKCGHTHPRILVYDGGGDVLKIQCVQCSFIWNIPPLDRKVKPYTPSLQEIDDAIEAFYLKNGFRPYVPDLRYAGVSGTPANWSSRANRGKAPKGSF